MARILRREAAKRDLIAQWVWYAENAGIEVADRFLEAVQATLKILSKHPTSGASARVRKTELQGLRQFPVVNGFEAILLFYFPLEDGADLVRVVHGRRNLSRLEKGGFFEMQRRPIGEDQ